MSVVAPAPQAALSAKPSLNCSVAGFRATSHSAWPGRTSAVILLGGCNLRCSYCCCPELLGGRLDSICAADVLSRIRNHDSPVSGVVVTGGEPTADTGLTELLRRLRSHDLPVRLDTNGTFPGVLETILAEDLVSFVALDVKTTPERYDAVTASSGSWRRVRRSIELLVDGSTDHEFRTTCYPSAVHTSDIPTIARSLQGGIRYVLQQFRAQRTLDPAASGVRPHEADALRRAALCCSVHLPTVVRGV
jgi:pyruvate formate lyase activating enzyme